MKIYAKNYDKVMPVTTELNGYPVPETGAFIFARTFEELQEIQRQISNEDNKYDSKARIEVATWKNGWHVCHEGRFIYNEQDANEWYAMALESAFDQVVDENLGFVVTDKQGNTDIYPNDLKTACISSPIEIDTNNYQIGVFIDFEHEDIEFIW